MHIIRQIPNIITLFNLLAGCISIVFAAEGNLLMASAMIFVAAVFDFLDGFAARMLKAYSAIGAQLDSLADVVSFGVAPGIIMYYLILYNPEGLVVQFGEINLLPHIAMLIPLFSALRLAKFNVDERQTDSFLGLPTPATAIFIASLPFVLQSTNANHPGIYDLLADAYTNIVIVLMLSFLMVTELPLFAIKFKSMNLKANALQYMFLVIAVILLVIFRLSALPLIIIAYVLLSLLAFLFGKKKHTD